MMTIQGSQEPTDVAIEFERETYTMGSSTWTRKETKLHRVENNILFVGLPASTVTFVLTGKAGADVKGYFVRVQRTDKSGDVIVPTKKGNRAEWTPTDSHVGNWNVEVVKGTGRSARVKHTSKIHLSLDSSFVQRAEGRIKTAERRITTLTGARTALEGQLDLSVTKTGELTKNLGVVSKSRNELQQQNKLQQQELQQLKATIRQLEAEKLRAQKREAGLQRRLDGMQKRLSCTVCTRFDKDTVHTTHNMSDNAKSVTATACQSGGQISFLEGTLRDGIHKVEMKFDNCSGSFYRTGFIQENRMNEFLGGQGQAGSIGALPGSWGYKFDGTKFAGNTTAVKYGCDWRNKTVLATVDFNQGTISFAVDGVDQGVAFTGVKGPLLACVQVCCSGKATVTRQTLELS